MWDKCFTLEQWKDCFCVHHMRILLFRPDPGGLPGPDDTQFIVMKSDLWITPWLFVAGLQTGEVIMRKLVLLSS